MPTERFTIDARDWLATGRVRVRENGELTPGRFHTLPQAQAWINLKLDKAAKANGPQTGMPGRARAYLLPADLWESIVRNGAPDAGH